ncbi:MAG: protein-methionine-sulfoxide reductase catalytic subunit MsrP [Pseudomonadota bacterium]|nr:protein-methionine-sulfoxide reductase catalytic subunit MsrP [Pseudomonadota bacterium]
MKIPMDRILPSEITPERVYRGRRELLTAGLAGAALATLGLDEAAAAGAEPTGATVNAARNAALSITDKPNSWEDITTYNNFYEFGTEKHEPAIRSRDFKATPWDVTIDGECEVKGKFALEDVMQGLALEERVYRLRCVEAWSMVIPWAGFPLAALLAKYKPTSKAKFVEFTTLHDARRMPGQRVEVLDWPYVEGLRMDEAMHPLTFIATGLYGRVLPNQNGAPLRLVVPWKYGFKNIKSIVRIRFTERQPMNSWQKSASHEYGFYANVNPAVSHPRWSQATERRIGSGSLLGGRSATLPFNGYAAQVASLYAGMDPRRLY